MSVNKVNKTTGDLSLLAGGTLFADNPIGSIIPYGGATAPAGWFICDGTELVRSTYPELFAVIGTSFGTPSDNTKFKLPDLREATTKGVGLTGKSNNHMDADGLALGEFIDDRVQSHKHNVAFKAVKTFGAGASWGAEYDDSTNPTTTIEPQTGRKGDTTEVKAVGVNYIIKAVSVGVPADFMSAVDDAVDKAMSDIGTASITELSALANIGTSANATQHDVNVAVDSVIEEMQQYDDTGWVKIQGLTPISQIDVVNLHAKRKGNVVTLRWYLEINLIGSTHNTLNLLPAGSIPAKYRPSVSSPVTALGYRESETTFTIGRFVVDTDGSMLLGEYYTTGNDQAVTIFNIEMTYVV